MEVIKFKNMNKSFISELDSYEVLSPNRTLLTFEGVPYSFAFFSKWIKSFVNYLAFHHGIENGDHVAIMTRNCLDSALLIYALAKMGAVWVPINAEQRGKALKYIIDDSNPKLMILDEDTIKPLESSDARNLPLVLIDEFSKAAKNAVYKDDWTYASPDASDILTIMYTSGTTGPPKGVAVTHEMMCYAINGVRELTSPRKNDIFFQWEPFYHIAGAQMLFLPMLEEVETHIVKRFSASKFWTQVKQARATHIHYLGGVLSILLKRPESEFVACPNLRIAWGGGCSESIWEKVERKFNVEVRECYGMTEASSLTTVNIEGPKGSVGRSLPWVEVGVRDELGADAGLGVPGEIVIKQKEFGVLFGGYLNKAEATDKVLSNNTFRTGDRGWMDSAGYLYFAGRLTDSVRHKGENVSSWEVESTVIEHPEVEDAAMVGVEADIGEQDIHLYVQTKEEGIISEQELYEWMKHRLARYQLPRYITFIDDFPRTPSLRIKKKLLRSNQGKLWQSH